MEQKFISCFLPDPARVRKTRHNRELQRNDSRCKCSSRPASPYSRADRQRPKQKRFKCVNFVFNIIIFQRFSTWGTQIVSRGYAKYHNLCEWTGVQFWGNFRFEGTRLSEGWELLFYLTACLTLCFSTFTDWIIISYCLGCFAFTNWIILFSLDVFHAD